MKPSVRHTTETCRPASEILARIGDKWTILVIMSLSERKMRFTELKREVEGISQRMLTMTLRGLERDGMVIRTVTPTIPPRVDYELSPLGRSLREPVLAIGQWASLNRPAILKARQKFDGKAQKVPSLAVQPGG